MSELELKSKPESDEAGPIPILEDAGSGIRSKSLSVSFGEGLASGVESESDSLVRSYYQPELMDFSSSVRGSNILERTRIQFNQLLSTSLSDSEETSNSRSKPLINSIGELPKLGSLVKHHHLLTQHKRDLLDLLWTIVYSKATQTGLFNIQAAIDVEKDPEENTGQVVLRVYVGATPVQTMAFWDGLSLDLDQWLETLPSSHQRTLLYEIGLRFHWLTNG